MMISKRAQITRRLLLAVSTVAILVLTACGSGSTTTAAEPTTEVELTTRGAIREFPELLKKSEGLTIGPVISTWQTYLDDSVMAFEDNVWDLCEDERGSALGSRMNGNILWTLGPPLPELQSNELFLDVYEVGEKTGLMFVLSYEESNPVLKPIEPRNLYNPKPLEYSAPAIPFKLYELTRCENIGSNRE